MEINFKKMRKRGQITFGTAATTLVVVLLILAAILGGMKESRQEEPNYANISAPDGALLKPLMISRIPGSPGSAKVRAFLMESMQRWHLQTDTFTQLLEIPGFSIGHNVTFTNLIFTKNPRASRKIVLAAHYDSKMTVAGQVYPGQFIGATDSAWPCALILELARSLDLAFDNNDRYTLQLIFFDGEEAFGHWSAEDSIYGARHLAAQSDEGRILKIDEIDLFILFDLLGAAQPRIPNYYHRTSHHYHRLAWIEDGLRQAGRLHSTMAIFQMAAQPLGHETVLVEDDHVPFLRRGVPVLHIIPYPFPECWHSLRDGPEVLHNPTIHDITLIFFEFLKSYGS